MLRDFATAFIYSLGITRPVLVCNQGHAETLAWSGFKSMIKGLSGKVPHSQGPGIFGLPWGGDLISGSNAWSNLRVAHPAQV